MEVCPPPRLRAGSERGRAYARQNGCACASSGPSERGSSASSWLRVACLVEDGSVEDGVDLFSKRY